MSPLKFSIRRRTLSVLALLVCLEPIHVGAAPLADVVRHVLDTHPDVTSASALLDAAGERLRQSRSAYLPTAGLSWEQSTSTEDIGDASIDRDVSRLDATLRWNLFRGFADRSAVASSEAGEDASAAELAAVQESLALRVIEVYLDVLKNQRLVAVSAQQIESLTELTERVSTRAEMGRISKVTIHQAKTRLVQAKSRHFQLRAALEASRLRFREITGMAPDALETPRIDTAIADEPIEALYRKAIDGSPRIEAARKTLASREAEVGVAAGALLPTVDLELRKRLASDLSPEDSVDPDSTVRLVVNYAFETGGAGLGRKAEAVYRKQAAAARIASLEREIRADIASASRQLVEERNIAPSLAENVDSAEEVVKAYHLQFDAGRRTLLDLLTAYADLYQAQAAVVENRYRQMALAARIRSLTGKLRESLAANVTRDLEG